MNIQFILNGRPVSIETSPMTPLSEILRNEFGLHRNFRGCGNGFCGRCIVLVDNEAVTSCLQPVFRIKGKSVLTYEGFSGSEDCRDIEAGFEEARFVPCPVHRPGYIFLVHSLLEKTSHPGNEEVAPVFSGFHPVCGGYSALLEGVKKAALRRFTRHNEQTR